MESLPGGLSNNKKIDPFIYDLFPSLKIFFKEKEEILVEENNSN